MENGTGGSRQQSRPPCPRRAQVFHPRMLGKKKSCTVFLDDCWSREGARGWQATGSGHLRALGNPDSTRFLVFATRALALGVAALDNSEPFTCHSFKEFTACGARSLDSEDKAISNRKRGDRSLPCVRGPARDCRRESARRGMLL